MRKVDFDREFEYKDLPDETTPDNSENANKSIHNTWYLLQQLENLIDSKTGSNIEITECAEAMLNKLEIEGKSVQDGEPSPGNPIEIKSVGYTNLFNIERFIKEYNALAKTSSYNKEGFDYFAYADIPRDSMMFMKGEFKENTRYTFHTKGYVNNYENGNFTSLTITYTDKTSYDLRFTSGDLAENSYITTENKTVDYICLNSSGGKGMFVKDICLYEGSISKQYIPFGKVGLELTITKDSESKTTTFILNEPLRSLPNETKDLLYVKGGRLFVERNTKELVLNGSENWTKDLSNNSYLLQNSSIYGLWATACAYSNRFKYSHTDAYYCRADSFAIDSNHRIIIAIQNISTLEDFKAWLNSNNVIIVAKLVEPVIEDLGEIQIPITFKDKSTITTTDELEPTINLEYVKDTILTDYIEKRLMNLIK